MRIPLCGEWKRENKIKDITIVFDSSYSNPFCSFSPSQRTARRQPRRLMSYPPEAHLPVDLPIKIAAVNINSITSPGRLSELQYFADTNEIDILAVSEVKIDQTVHPCLFSLQTSTSLLSNPDKARRWCGYLHKKVTSSFRAAFLENDEFESVWVKIKVKNKQMFICSSYLPPHTPADKQIRYLDYLTDSVTKAYAHSPALVAVVGDQNAGNCWLPPRPYIGGNIISRFVYICSADEMTSSIVPSIGNQNCQFIILSDARGG